MKLKFLFIATSTVALLVTPALAADWIESAHGKNKTVFYFDASGLKPSVDTQTIWVKAVKAKPDEDGAISSTGRYRFSCSAMSYTTLSVISHKPDGTVAQSVTLEPYRQKVEIAAPDTVFETVLNDVCALAGN